MGEEWRPSQRGSQKFWKKFLKNKTRRLPPGTNKAEADTPGLTREKKRSSIMRIRAYPAAPRLIAPGPANGGVFYGEGRCVRGEGLV